MESALEVLSRAASMVEHNDYQKQHALRQGSNSPTPARESAGPDYGNPHGNTPANAPGNQLKRSHEEQSGDNTKKTAGTQTAFTLFTSTSTGQPSSANRPTSLVHPYSSATGTRHRYPAAAPSPSSPSRPHPYHRHARSVLRVSPTAATTPPSPTPTMPLSHSTAQTMPPSPTMPLNLSTAATRSATPPEMNNNASPSLGEDPAIEEHFRRSLGHNYTEMVRRSSSRSPSSSPAISPSTPSSQAVRITGASTVDDHFAKSLGSTWYELKAREEATDSLNNSVDDHFAKALGNTTWLRIKAEKEGGAHSASSTPTTPTTNGFPASFVQR